MPTLSHQGPPLQNFTLESVPYLNILSVTYLVPSGHWSYLSDRGYWGKININQQLFRCITFPDKKSYFDTQLQQAMSYPKEITLMGDVSDDLAGLCKNNFVLLGLSWLLNAVMYKLYMCIVNSGPQYGMCTTKQNFLHYFSFIKKSEYFKILIIGFM